ncbi:hypothetical protein EIP86_010718 [Pleurotus ostreatoroseus]|nr:hypothetical protein EIP86_010718 [Pleurotus ostreatoroseus]
MTSSSDESSYSDKSGACVPASSSTVIPSSPARGQKLVDDPEVQAVISSDSDSIYAATKASNRSRSSKTSNPWTSARATHNSGRKTSKDTRLLSTDPSRILTSNVSDVSMSSSKRSEDLLASVPRCNEDQDPEDVYDGRHDTPEARERFSRLLTKLLLYALEQQGEPQEASPASESSRTRAMDTDLTLDAVHFAPALIALDASDSFYAADISNFGTHAQSMTSSWSASTCSAVSQTCTSSFSSSSDSGADFVIETPVRYAGRLVYDAESESVSSSLSHSSESSLDENTPGLYVFPVDEPLNTAHTPMAQSHSAYIPDAPKKIQHHIHTRPDNLQSQPSSRGKKRPRSPSLATSASDAPAQDVQQDEMASTPVDEVGQQSKICVQPMSLTRKETLRERSLLLAKRRKISMPARSLKQKVAAQTHIRQPVKSLASFRRAASMRSEAQVTELLKDEDVDMSESQLVPTEIEDNDATIHGLPSARIRGEQDTPMPAAQDKTEYCPPTRPITPGARERHNDVTPSDSPLPIIAPPPFEFIPSPALSPEASAETRICRLKEKDMNQRIGDGLLPQSLVVIQIENANEMTADEQMMWQMTDSPESHSDEDKAQTAQARQDEDYESLRIESGIDLGFRADIIEWMLDVNPPTVRSQPLICANLRAQLAECPVTRWHAAHLFTRYFLRLGTTPSSPPVKATAVITDGSGETMTEREAVAWDCVIACLAFSVKLHRDFLEPLFPVVSTEYLLIAPHVMTHEDLEAAQREVLQAFDYSLGTCTPGAYFEELYNALQSLRTLITTHGSWDVAQREAWEILYDCLIDQDYVRYPVHVLAGCSLVFGLVESVAFKKQTEHAMALYPIAAGQAPPKRSLRRTGQCDCKRFKRKAQKAVHTVETDIRELLGISTVRQF